MYYDKNGEQITTDEWIKKFENNLYKRIHFTQHKLYTISTVWLGIDHRFTDKGMPLIFETMVFDEDGEIDMKRYTTLEDAQSGHWDMVEQYS